MAFSALAYGSRGHLDDTTDDYSLVLLATRGKLSSGGAAAVAPSPTLDITKPVGLPSPEVDLQSDPRRFLQRTISKGKDRVGDRITSRRALGNADVEEFTTMMWQTLLFVRPALKFVPAYPDWVLDNPSLTTVSEPNPQIPDETITWNIIRKEPASQTGTPFGPRKQRRAKIREEQAFDPYEELLQPSGSIDHVVSTYGQEFENIIQFDIWTKSNFEAERLVSWFETFMDDYTDLFERQGIKSLLFERRLRDELIMAWRNGLVNRSVQYYFRTERINTVWIPTINRINIVLDTIRDYGLTIDDISDRSVQDALKRIHDETL